MVLHLCVMPPYRIVWNFEVWEIVLSTNSGDIGILPNHAPLLAALDMGVLKIRSDGQWSAMALMGGFTMIDNNRAIILVNKAERASKIDPNKSQRGFQKAQAELAEAEGRRRIIEANLTFKRAKARLKASTTVEEGFKCFVGIGICKIYLGFLNSITIYFLTNTSSLSSK
ncbi:hypothetical protein L7F22_013623 [Adiantum nelumboides]|nr:hypothetical protein [Adiantum nelumboides]